jgi:hypothetical protein
MSAMCCRSGGPFAAVGALTAAKQQNRGTYPPFQQTQAMDASDATALKGSSDRRGLPRQTTAKHRHSRPHASRGCVVGCSLELQMLLCLYPPPRYLEVKQPVTLSRLVFLQLRVTLNKCSHVLLHTHNTHTHSMDKARHTMHSISSAIRYSMTWHSTAEHIQPALMCLPSPLHTSPTSK